MHARIYIQDDVTFVEIICHGDSRAMYNLTKPIPLKVEHMAVESVMEPLCPSGPSLQTVKTSA